MGQRAADDEQARVGPHQMGPELGERTVEVYQLEADDHAASIFSAPVKTGTGGR